MLFLILKDLRYEKVPGIGPRIDWFVESDEFVRLVEFRSITRSLSALIYGPCRGIFISDKKIVSMSFISDLLALYDKEIKAYFYFGNLMKNMLCVRRISLTKIREYYCGHEYRRPSPKKPHDKKKGIGIPIDGFTEVTTFRIDQDLLDRIHNFNQIKF